jgi:hypothetical protein
VCGSHAVGFFLPPLERALAELGKKGPVK